MRNLLGTSNNTDLIYRSNFGTESAVYTQNFAVDNSCKNEKVKDVAAGLPHRSVAIFLLALLIKAVDLCDLPRFVVASDKNNSIGVSIPKLLAVERSFDLKQMVPTWPSST